jgi:hypothetical protein
MGHQWSGPSRPKTARGATQMPGRHNVPARSRRHHGPPIKQTRCILSRRRFPPPPSVEAIGAAFVVTTVLLHCAAVAESF